MTISDTPKSISDGFIYQVISSSDSILYYLIIRERITTYLFMLCRYHADLYKPRVKMRDKYLRTSGHTRLAICTRGDTIDMHMKQVIEQATTCHHVAMWKWDQAGHATHVVWKSKYAIGHVRGLARGKGTMFCCH